MLLQFKDFVGMWVFGLPSAIVWVFTLGPSPAAAFTTIFEANKIKKGKV